MELTNVPGVRDLLDAAPGKFNNRTFIKYLRSGEVIEKSFGEVRENSLAFCRMLRSVFPEKTHIAIISKSSYEYIVSLTGSIISGNIAVPISPETTVKEASDIINDADITAVLYEPEFAEKTGSLKELCPKVSSYIDFGDEESFCKIYEEYGENSVYAPLSDYKPDIGQCSLIIYTSGTTGDKKGVMLSQKALVGNMMFKPYNDIVNRADVILSVLPLYHIFCFVTDYLGPLKNGNVLCLNGSMRDLFSNLLLFKPNQMRVVPMIASALLGRIKAVAARHPELTLKEASKLVTGGNLDMMLSGGAYLDPSLCREFDEIGVFLRQGYGMSETGCKVTVPDEDTSIECVGRVMNICDVRIKDCEIQVNTPCKTLGYYKRPEDTEALFTEDGWIKTGDIGFLTEDRQLFVTGRVKNLIILSNGENVSPEGIEKRYKEYPLVCEVLVYAEKDVICAAVYPDSEYAEREGITDIASALDGITDEINMTAPPSHTVAKVIIRTEPLEKTATGKIMRKAAKSA